MKRVILHSDMNACYASIEAKLNPKLKGIPTVSYTHLTLPTTPYV